MENKPIHVREEFTPETIGNINAVRDKALIALIKRAGGSVRLSMGEVARANDILIMDMAKDKKTGQDVFVLSTQVRN